MNDDYEVGYAKPPKYGQFKPGFSGNPKGRPKGKKNLRTIFAEELNELVWVTEGGKKIKVTKQHALIKTLTAKALNGDTRSALALIKLCEQYEAMESELTALGNAGALSPEGYEIDINKVLDGLGV